MEKEDKLIVSKARFNYIDLLKTIAIIMVLSLHTGIWHGDFISNNSSKVTYCEYAIRLICEGVPIFVMINGFLILHKKLDLKKHYKKILKIFGLLILWTSIDILLLSYLNKEKVTIKSFLLDVFKTDVGYKYSGALWFIQKLLLIYLIYPAIKTLYDNNKKAYNYLFLTVTLFNFIPPFLNLIADFINKPGFYELKNEFNNCISRFNPFGSSYYLFYFMLGGYFYELKDKLDKHKLIEITIGIICYILAVIIGIYLSLRNKALYSNNYLYSQILLIPIILALLAICMKFKKNNVIIGSVGKNTMGIYVIHPIVIALLNKIDCLSKFNNMGLCYRFIFLILVFLASYLITLIISKIPKLNNIIKI